MDKINKELVDALDKTLEDLFEQGNLKEKVKKKLNDTIYEIENYLEYELKENLRAQLSSHAVSMAEDSVEALLKGDVPLMMRYLSASKGYYTGRDYKFDVMLNGTIFEPSPIELRAKIVNDYAELLKTEYILDLEAKVEAYKNQIIAEKKKFEDYYERSRYA